MPARQLKRQANARTDYFISGVNYYLKKWDCSLTYCILAALEDMYLDYYAFDDEGYLMVAEG